MITFDEALAIVVRNSYLLEKEEVLLPESVGRVLAEDVFSDINMPPFNRSAVDGFACRREDIGMELRVIGTVRAGMFPEKKTGPGECTRIMTGAPVPEGADCVLMVEETVESGADRIRFAGQHTKANISLFAEDVRAGDCVLKSGTLIAPQHVAIMASVGCIRPKVSVRPGVAVIATGDEIVEPDRKPGLSQIRNSNGYQLTAQAVKSGAEAHYLGIAPDTEEDTYRILNNALDEADVILLTGGVSMGTFDFVPHILERSGIEILFRTISVQPGKPTVFGIKGKKRIFGLPGNPVSSFTIFEILVKPLLWKMMGVPQPVGSLRLPIGVNYRRTRAGRMQWFPVQVREGKAYPLEYHGSAHIFSLATADAIAAIPLNITNLDEGDLIDVRPV